MTTTISFQVSHLGAQTDNYAKTTLNYFFQSVKEYAVPGRVCVDGGREFNHIKTFMNELDGSRRCIRGKSVHNNRIEWLWHDVSTKVLLRYYTLFYHMKSHSIFNVENDVHLFALHFVFEGRINRNLSIWREAHNNHRLRTAKNCTPLQLWFGGIIRDSRSMEYSATRNIFFNDDAGRQQQIRDFRDTHQLTEPQDMGIVLQRIPPPLTQGQFEELTRSIDVLAPSDSKGIDIYVRVIRFIRGAMRM